MAIALDEAMDVALDQALADAYAPLDLLVGIDPLDLAAAGAAVVFGAGACARDGDGAVTGCPWPAPVLGSAWFCVDDGACAGASCDSGAPAFGATGVPPVLALGTALDGPLAPSLVQIQGRLDGLPDPGGLASGTLDLFLPESAAAAASLAPPLMAPETLWDLLDPAAVEDEDGVTGWWLHLGFEAARAPLLP
jgi:hypothetical protein